MWRTAFTCEFPVLYRWRNWWHLSRTVCFPASALPVKSRNTSSCLLVPTSPRSLMSSARWTTHSLWMSSARTSWWMPWQRRYVHDYRKVSYAKMLRCMHCWRKVRRCFSVDYRCDWVLICLDKLWSYIPMKQAWAWSRGTGHTLFFGGLPVLYNARDLFQGSGFRFFGIISMLLFCLQTGHACPLSHVQIRGEVDCISHLLQH